MRQEMRLMRLVVVSALCLMMGGSVWADDSDNPWTEVRRNGDIVVFQKRSPDPDWILLRGECLVAAPVDVAAGFLSNMAEARRIFPHCKERRLLKGYSEGNRIEYWRFRLIWPFQGRYFVQQYEERATENGGAWISLNGIDDYPLDVEGLVRSQMRNTHIALEPLDGTGQTHVSAQIEVNMGGWLPNWLVRIGIRLGMNDMFVNLKRAIKAGEEARP